MALPQRPARRRNRLAIAAGISIAAHLLFLPFLARELVFQPPKGVRSQAVSIVAQPRSQVQHAQVGPNAQGPTSGWSNDVQPQLPKAVPEKPPEPQPLNGQIVSLGTPKDERAPEKTTKYLSEKDSRVEKETRARDTSAFYKNALSKAQKEGKNEKAANAAPAATAGGAAGEGGGGPEQKRSQQPAEMARKDRRDPLRVQPSPDGTLQRRGASDAVPGTGRKLALADPGRDSSSSDVGPGAAGAKPGLPGKQGPLKLTLDNPLGALGPVSGGAMPDELRGVEEGDETLLNSRSFKYAGFLNRVKETVGRVWTQRVQDESTKRDPSGQLFSYRDRRTVVEFTLDRQGEITEVHIVGSSGVQYLDSVAVEAFRIVQRFPNPPPGLVGEAGSIKLPFAFTLLAAANGLRLQVGPAYLPGSPAARGF